MGTTTSPRMRAGKALRPNGVIGRERGADLGGPRSCSLAGAGGGNERGSTSFSAAEPAFGGAKKGCCWDPGQDANGGSQRLRLASLTDEWLMDK
ncbi:hypothetical protein M407DRAFT_162858 [Tulasnella calospora MUT 4182]|uniref:Uncharacterized protein n=1 Tax=Tulasnella calospora MUT 4182 TaxID=1051891 RepID=A0A0C3K9L1_9AGAM|nr:hypothetical protein M407DRAFT_162858 [Tulasnella calospora MUT 4182]